MGWRRYLVVFTCFCCFLVISATIKGASPIQYLVQCHEAKNHYIHVTMTIPVADAKQCELMMPVWTPGSYLIREYAQHVDHVGAEDGNGRSLKIQKSAKNRWTVTCGNAAQVAVSYRIFCWDLSVRTNFADQSLAVLNGAATFLAWVGQENRPHWVTVQLPDRWQRSMCSLPLREGAGPNAYAARNFDELVDSPLIAGNPDLYPFNVGGRDHWLVNVGGDDLWDGAKAAADLARVVAEQQRFWGVIPYDRYYFLNVIAEGKGGLEHDACTLVMSSRWAYRDKAAYRKWLGLMSHEFFHTWNVRTLRPAALLNYDYESEQYFKTLWVAEGITSYYDDLCLVRAGLIDAQAYLALLSGQIERLQTTPGRHHQSLAESSRDTWIKFYRPHKHDRNCRISYYNKGAVASFLLDAMIRERTQGRRSLDDVMRLLYKQHAGGKGYTSADFRKLACQVAGCDLLPWFAKVIDTTRELDYRQALAWFGLTLSERGQGTKEAEGKQPWTGLTLEDRGGRWVVDGVADASPAYRAGINIDDELIAVNRFRVSSKNWDKVLIQVDASTPLEILVARRGALMTLPLVTAKPPRAVWRLVPASNPTDAQKRHFENWLKPSAQPSSPQPADAQPR